MQQSPSSPHSEPAWREMFFYEREIADGLRIPEYSYDQLPQAKKDEVLAMVRHARQQRRARLITVLVALVLILLALIGIAIFPLNLLHW